MDLTWLYTPLKLGHFLLAIVAVGFNATYGIWLARAASEPQHLSHVLRGIKTLDDRFANPAYVLLLVTGLSMVFVGGLPLTTLWIAAALLLWPIAIAIGFGLFTPALRRQIRVLEAEGAESAAFRQASIRTMATGLITFVPVAVILLLMVVKPTRLL